MLDTNSPILPHIFLFKRLEESKMHDSGKGVVIFFKLIVEIGR